MGRRVSEKIVSERASEGKRKWREASSIPEGGVKDQWHVPCEAE